MQDCHFSANLFKVYDGDQDLEVQERHFNTRYAIFSEVKHIMGERY